MRPAPMYARLGMWRERASSWVQAYLAPRYRQLSARERLLLAVTAVTLPALFVVFVLWLPMRDAITSLQQELPQLQEEWHEVQRLAAKLRAKAGEKHNSTDALTLVEQAAQKSGVRRHIQRIKPVAALGDEQRLQVLMRQAPYAQAIRFLGELAARNLVLDRVRLHAKPEPGMVDLELLVLGG